MTGVSRVAVFFTRDRLQQLVSDSGDLRQRRRLPSYWRHGVEPGRRQGRALPHAQLRRHRVLRTVRLQGTVSVIVQTKIRHQYGAIFRLVKLHCLVFLFLTVSLKANAIIVLPLFLF